MYGTKQLNVVSLVVQKTGTYNEQVRRPYASNMEGPNAARIINSLHDAMSQRNLLTSQNFVLPENSFITQQAQFEGYIPISNGWGTARLRFILQLQQLDHMGVLTNIYVSGYTDYDDRSFNGLIDPNSKFFINSMSSTRNITNHTPLGTSVYQNVIDSSQVLVNRNYDGALQGKHVFSMQPENIFANWDNIALGTGDNADNQYVDTRVQLNGTPIKSKRINAISPTYSASILNTYIQASRENNSDQTDVLQNCQKIVSSQDATKDPFIEFLMQQRSRESGSYAMLFDGTFSIKDLIALDPNTPNVTKTNTFIDGLHQAGQTANWHGSDRTTLTASTLAQSIPGYMAGHQFQFVIFTSTNIGTINGDNVTTVQKVEGWNSHLDQSKEVQSFIFRLNNEIMKNISMGGLISYELMMKVDTFGETWTQLSLNGEEAVIYVAPTFADALATPVVTIDRNNLDNITRDADSISSQLWENNSGGMRALSMSGDIHI